MIPALAAVAQSRRAPLRLRNYQATGEVETSDYGGLLKPVELEMYSRLARTMGYDKLVLLANAQSSSLGHSLGPGVANIIAGLNLERSAVPWWAYWSTIDRIATYAMALSAALVIALIGYIGHTVREFRKRTRYAVLSPWAQPAAPVY